MTRASDAARPLIAVIAAGGTLTALAEDPFEICDYGQAGSLSARELIGRCAALEDRFAFLPVEVPPRPSFDIALPDWLALCRLCEAVLADCPGLSGVVLTHGTGSLEETAFFLSLVWDLPVPLVVTGAQRPASALGSDGYINFHQAACVAAYPAARDLGVLVVAHGEVHLPAAVTKTTNFGLDTFRSPDLGPVGQVIGGRVMLARRPTAPRRPVSFDWRAASTLPRVDIVSCYSGADACAVDAFIAAGARGLVTAGFAPGYATGPQARRLERWIRAEGGVVVAASRAAGPVVATARNSGHGFLPAGPYTPPKARILLQLALAAGCEAPQIEALFDL